MPRSITLSFLAFLFQEMGSTHCSKYLILRLKLNKRIETMNEMNLTLGRVSDHYLMLAQELVQTALKKSFG